MVIKQMSALAGRDGSTALNYLSIRKEFLFPRGLTKTNNEDEHNYSSTGPDVQDIFYTLENTGEANDYAAVVNALNAYFAPKVNSAYARHTFRQLQQNADETVLQFASRLKRYAKDCDYGTDTDNQIRDEILQKCKSDYLRRKRLEEGPGLILARTLELAQQCEKPK